MGVLQTGVRVVGEGSAAVRGTGPVRGRRFEGEPQSGGNGPPEGDNRGVRITGIDHVVLTVASVEASVDFYSRVLGLDVVTFGRGRTALRLGDQKINLHPADAPHAARPAPGSADLCLVVVGEPDDAVARLADCGVPVELGPVDRAGALGPVRSLYVRDPDRNLVELAFYDGA